MAISDTSKRASRTIGLKPVLMGLKSANAKLTLSETISPFFSAEVTGWSPSNVFNLIMDVRPCCVASGVVAPLEAAANPVAVADAHDWRCAKHADKTLQRLKNATSRKGATCNSI